MSAASHDPDERTRSERKTWPIRRFELGHEPTDDLSDVTTPEARIAMMWQLVEAGWRLSGRSWPTYDRHEAPTRLFRPGTRPLDDE